MRNILRRYFRRDNDPSVDFSCREERSNLRFHLATLLSDLMLQILSIINANQIEVCLLIQSKYNNAALILI